MVVGSPPRCAATAFAAAGAVAAVRDLLIALGCVAVL